MNQENLKRRSLFEVLITHEDQIDLSVEVLCPPEKDEVEDAKLQDNLDWDSASVVFNPQMPDESEPQDAAGQDMTDCQASAKQENSQNQEIKNFVFVQKKLKKQNKNTPRFLVRLALKHLPEYKSLYPAPWSQRILEKCIEWQQWRLGSKKNVYLIDHLKYLFRDGKEFPDHVIRKNRFIFHQILRRNSLDLMMEPKSQIKKNRVDYLRSAKIYSLRCRHQDLTIRNQCQ